ncbi:MAG: type II toxin-antitoxin system prevent-host-death family antitoxin [Chloroflexota bacterium]|nr:type II toxin-antitoxin system prevent-host-death family antitoxin [Chloroflexota bacterium]MDE2695215.1 type II toxin-antitoxin system prevent-host-death family antitoxin [Chloroflexota bacterium]MYE31565.1 type II toxin-antitoxin system prevent-host-death family antitoxin [Chloroflexota bacterium]
MTTYGIREFKARLSEILRSVENGDEAIITRRGRPSGRLVPVRPTAESGASLLTLRDAFADLPDADYEDFEALKSAWQPRVPEIAGGADGRGG